MSKRSSSLAAAREARLAGRVAAALLLGIAALIAAYFGSSALRTNTLEFRNATFPEGFRELVTAHQVSRFDPLLGAGKDAVVSRQSKTAVCDSLFNDAATPAFGDEGSKARIVTFFDYRCPYCKVLSKVIAGLRDSSTVRVIYKEWPVLGDSSVLAARAALAAQQQRTYVEFHTRLMNSGFIPTPSYIEVLAHDLNLDWAKLSEDMNSVRTTAEIEGTMALARQLGFVGTPALVVGHTIVQGAITQSQLERLIENESSQSFAGSC